MGSAFLIATFVPGFVLFNWILILDYRMKYGCYLRYNKYIKLMFPIVLAPVGDRESLSFIVPILKADLHLNIPKGINRFA